MNLAGLNSAALNGVAYNGAVAPTSSGRGFGLFVVSAAGVRQVAIDYWRNGRWTQALSQPSTISLDLSLDDDVAQSGHIAAPKQLLLVNDRGIPVDRFVIARRAKRYGSDGATLHIEGVGLLTRLDNQFTGEYSATTTVTAHIAAWLALQTGSNPIRLGYIVPAIGGTSVAWSAETKSVLGELHRMQKIFGGHLYVDAGGALNWMQTSTVSARAVYHLRENLDSYEEEIDYQRVYNRVRAIGATVDGVPVTLTAPGYVEDATSIATHDVHELKIREVTIRSQATVTLWANAVLQRAKNGITVSRMRALDLAQVQTGIGGVPVLLESGFYVGAPIKVVKPTNMGGGTVATYVTAIDRSLDDPLAGTFEVGDRFEERNVEDEIADLRGAVVDGQDELPPTLDTAMEQIDELIELADCPPDYGDADDVLKSTGTAAAWGRVAFTELSDAPDSLTGHAGKSVVVNDDETALELVTPASLIFITGATLADLGSPTGPALGEVTGSNAQKGFWKFPSGGASNADWRQDLEVIVATSKTNLGNPGRVAKGYVTTAGAEFGWWTYPPGGSSNDDWVPENLYSEAS